MASVWKGFDERVVRAKVNTFPKTYQAKSASDAIYSLLAIRVS